MSYVRTKKDEGDPPNVAHLLHLRQTGCEKKSYNIKKVSEIKSTLSLLTEIRCQLPPSARSTFLMTFSPDCTKVASSHGDHNIYISDIYSGKCLQKLEGHPRTPWCISFHPTSNDILASGCLAGEVRVWDLHGASEIWKTDHDQVIASLSFHPFIQLLVIATGSSLYFWDWSKPKPFAVCSTNSELERVRYVKFDLYGSRIITGISNMSASTSSAGSSSSQDEEENSRPPRNSRNVSLSGRRILHARRRSQSTRSPNSNTPPFNRSSNVSPSRRQQYSHITQEALSHFSGSSRTSDLYRTMQLLSNFQQEIDMVRAENAAILEQTSDPEVILREIRSLFSNVGVIPPDDIDNQQPNRNLDQNNGPSNEPDENFGHVDEPSRNPNEISCQIDESSNQSSRISHQNVASSNKAHDISDLSDESSNELNIISDESYTPPNQIFDQQDELYNPLNEISGQSAESNENTNDSDETNELNNILPLEFSNNLSDTPIDITDPYRLFNELKNIFQRVRTVCSELARNLISNGTLQRNGARSRRPGAANADSNEMDMFSIPEFDNPYEPLIDVFDHIQPGLRFQPYIYSGLQEQVNQIRLRINEILMTINVYSSGLPTGHVLKQIFERAVTQLTNEFESLLRIDEYLIRNALVSASSTFTSQGSQQNSSAENSQSLSSELSPAYISEELPTASAQSSSSQPLIIFPSSSIQSPPVTESSSAVSTMSISVETSFPSEQPSLSYENSLPGTSRQSSFERLLTLDTSPMFSQNESNSEWSERSNSVNLVRSSNNATSIMDDISPSPNNASTIPLSQNFRRNLSSQFSSNNVRQQRDRRPLSQSEDSDDDNENIPHTNDQYLTRPVITPARRRNIVIHPMSSVRQAMQGHEGENDVVLSDGSSEDSDRPLTPPLMMYPSSFRHLIPSTFHNGHSMHIALGDPFTQNHRIQSWDFSMYKLPDIQNANVNVVVQRCMIHNDASVDISQDGEKLVAIIPPEKEDSNDFMFGVYSLRRQDLGVILCNWGSVKNAISVSFSPFSTFVLFGCSSERPSTPHPLTTTAAKIVKIHTDSKGTYHASFVRYFDRYVNSENRFQQVSLNCVKWIPQPGVGIAYATNRGCLSICRATASEIFDEDDDDVHTKNGYSRATRQVWRASHT